MEFAIDLSRLDLSGNNVESVITIDSYNLLGRLFALRGLDLSRNQIQTFKEDMLAHKTVNLEFFNLSENLLESSEIATWEK